MPEFKGVFAVVPTPFTADGEIDHESLKRVADLYIGDGVHGLTILGVTSEVARLSDRERAKLMHEVLDHVNGRVPVVAGCTAPGLKVCVEYCHDARSAGADAVMVSPPRMPKLNSDAILHHLVALAERVDVDIVVQDFPPITGYTMEPSLLARIAREVPSAKAIKLEDPPTALKVARILEQAESTEIKILGGLGGVYFFEELLAGAAGTMTGFSYPKFLVEIFELFDSGMVEEAAEIFYRRVPVMRFESQPGIGMAIRKEILRRRGAIETSTIRLPGVPLDDGTGRALTRLMDRFELS